MGEDLNDAEPNLTITDSVVMGNINIISQETGSNKPNQQLELNLPHGDGLRMFIQEHWMNLLEKHTTEAISLEDHSKVLIGIFEHVFNGKLRPNEATIYRKILDTIMLDERVVKSKTIQTEINVINAFTILSVKKFRDFEKQIKNAHQRLYGDTSEDDLEIGIFELVRCWWKGEGQTKQETLIELAADAILKLTSEQNFMGYLGDWLIPILLKNHEHPSSTGFMFNETIWQEVRLDRYDESEWEYMWDRITRDFSISLDQYESIFRMVSNEEMELYPPLRHGGCTPDRFNFVVNSIRLMQVKCVKLLKQIINRATEDKIREFWNWMELMAMVSTLHGSVLFFDDQSFVLNKNVGVDDYSGAYMGWSHEQLELVEDVYSKIEELFSNLEKVSKAGGFRFSKSKMSQEKGTKNRVVGIINSLNGMYMHDGFYDYLAWHTNTNFIESWFPGHDSLRQGPRENLVLTKPDDMPLYWTGKGDLSKNPNFDDFFVEWQKGRKLSQF